MKDLAPLRQINTPVFHRPGIARTSRIHTKRLETHFRQHLGRGHVHRSGTARGGTRSTRRNPTATRRNISTTRSSVVYIGRSHCRTLSRAGGMNMLFRFVGRGILRFVARSEGFVTCTGEAVDLFAAFLPRGVDSGDAAGPNDIKLGFLTTHEQENGLKNKGRAAERGRSERKEAISSERSSHEIAPCSGCDAAHTTLGLHALRHLNTQEIHAQTHYLCHIAREHKAEVALGRILLAKDLELVVELIVVLHQFVAIVGDGRRRIVLTGSAYHAVNSAMR